MKTFRVYAKSITYCYVDVEAEDIYEAEDKSDEIDGGCWNTEPYGDWEVYMTEELED